MTDFEVISAAYYPSAKSVRPFLDSCHEHGFTPRLYGLKEKWTSYCHNKVSALISELIQVDKRYVLYLDSSDVIVQADRDDIWGAYNKIAYDGKTIVISGDRNCWPHNHLKQWFLDKCAPGSPFPYLCAGVFMGPRLALINALRSIEKAWVEGAASVKKKLQNDDQCWWMYQVCNGSIEAVTDSQGILVASTHSVPDEAVKLRRSGVHVYGNKPAIIHFNGDTSKRLRKRLGM